jgi:hypothetical protein
MEHFSAPPIILFTGDARGVLDHEAQQLGVKRVVYKPFLPHKMIDMALEVVNAA